MARPLFKYENWGTSVLPAAVNMALEEFLLKKLKYASISFH